MIFQYVLHLRTKGTNPPKWSDLDWGACQRSSTNKLVPPLMWLNANQNPPCRLKCPRIQFNPKRTESQIHLKHRLALWNHQFSRWRSAVWNESACTKAMNAADSWSMCILNAKLISSACGHTKHVGLLWAVWTRDYVLSPIFRRLPKHLKHPTWNN